MVLVCDVMMQDEEEKLHHRKKYCQENRAELNCPFIFKFLGIQHQKGGKGLASKCGEKN